MTNNEFREHLQRKLGREVVTTRPPHLSMKAEALVSKVRTRCTVCYTPAKPEELEPGTGRCTECMP